MATGIKEAWEKTKEQLNVAEGSDPEEDEMVD